MDGMNMVEEKKMQQYSVARQFQEDQEKVIQMSQMTEEQMGDQYQEQHFSKSEMSDYLQNQLGEKFDYSAPLEPAQEAELSKKGFAKRIMERRKMRKQREKQFNLRAKAMWQIHQNQGKKEDKEIIPGVPENPMRMENAPIFGQMRQWISELTCLSVEEKLQAMQRVNNVNLLCSSLMSGKIPDFDVDHPVTDFLKDGKYIEKSYFELKELNTLLQGKGDSTETLLYSISEMQENLLKSDDMLASMGDDKSLFKMATIKERLRYCNFGVALRTREQNQMFRIMETNLYNVREEKRLCDLERNLRKKTTEEKQKYLAKQVDETNAKCSLYEKKMIQELDGRVPEARNYKKRKNAGFLEVIKRDSEGNPLLSEEPRMKALTEIHEKRYGDKQNQIKDVVPYFMQQVDNMMDILRTLDFSPEGFLRLNSEHMSKVMITMGELTNIMADEKNLVNLLSKKDQAKVRMLDQNPFGTWSAGIQGYYKNIFNPEKPEDSSLDECVNDMLFSLNGNTFLQRHLFTKRDENGVKQKKVKNVDMNALMKEYIAEWDKMNASFKKSEKRKKV